MICKKCGENNDSLVTVCRKCGEPLTSGFLMCPHCGKIIKEEDKICPRCKKEIYVHDVVEKGNLVHEAYTPKYIISDYLSFPAILGIMIFMIWAFIYNLVDYLIVLYGYGGDLTIEIAFKLLIGSRNRMVVLTPLIILSIVTFVFRININRRGELDEMHKRLSGLKCLLMSDVTAFFTYFFVSYWEFAFNELLESRGFILLIGAFAGLILFIISAISLPLFFKKSKIRTR